MNSLIFRNKFSHFFWVTVLGLFSTSVSAALLERLGGQALYDPDLDITWINSTNLAATDNFNVGNIDGAGYMTLDASFYFVKALNDSNYLGFSDWRLPSAQNSDGTICSGSNCSGSEMGHLYYIEDTMQGQGRYWTWTKDGFFTYWTFDFYTGMQEVANSGCFISDFCLDWRLALVVRDGDVSPVPVPPAIWLFLSGLTAVIGLSRRRRLG